MKLEFDRKEVSYLDDIIEDVCKKEEIFTKEVVNDFYNVLVRYYEYLWQRTNTITINIARLGHMHVRKTLLKKCRNTNKSPARRFKELDKFAEWSIIDGHRNYHAKTPMYNRYMDMWSLEEFQNAKYKEFTGED